jgi:carbonic anhydrase
LQNAVRENVLAATDRLRSGSEILEHLIGHDGLLVVGAEYSLETGVVDFFHGVPENL